MMRKIVLFFLFTSAYLYADEALINKRDDVEFAKNLARYGYYDLAEEMRQLIKVKGSYEQKKESELLNCLFLKEKAQKEYEPDAKKATYKEAISCYEGHLTSAEGVQNLKLKLELADLMIIQAQEIIEEARQDKKTPTGVENILKGAQSRLQDVIGQTNDTGARGLDSQDGVVREKAEIYYTAWYALCRVYYFQGLAVDKKKLDLCSKELENYMIEYEGLIGSFYAMLLNGLVLHEKESFSTAIIFYDGVLRPLMHVDDPKAQELSLQACYYQTQTYIKWNRFSDALKNALEFQEHMSKTFGMKLEQEFYGQALLLEMGKAYIGQGEYQKALKIAEEVGSLQTSWGYVAKKLLLEWGKLNPAALQNAKNAYLVASGLYSTDKYQEAILAYLKVIEYSRDKEDIERYALDAWEKMGQMYWLLGLYQESAVCYETCAVDKRYRSEKKLIEKTVKGKTKTQKISITAKSAYWAYRGYNENFGITEDEYDKTKANEMRDYLVKYFTQTPYAKNLSYNTAEDKEKEARSEKNIKVAIQKYEKAAEAYRNVSRDADLYERAQVNIGKCFYNAAKQVEQEEDTLDKKPGEKAKQLYERAIKELVAYQEFTKRDEIAEIDIERKARRREALAQGLFFLGQSYTRLGTYDKRNYDKGIQALENLVNDYPEQGDMLAKSTYLLVRANIDNNNLEKAESFIKKTEELYGEDVSNNSTAIYRSFSYYMVGKEYYDSAIKKDSIYEDYKKNNHDDTKNALAAVTNDYVKSAIYLDKWNNYRNNSKLSAIEWVASTEVIAAKLLQDSGRDNEAKDMYKKALRLYRKCLAKNTDAEKEKDLQIKATECALETEDWEEAVLVFYPIFQQDRERRRSQKEDDDDILYVDYISRMLTGLSQQNNYKDANGLFNFLRSRLHLEFMNDLKKKYPDLSQASHKALFEEFVRVSQIIKEIEGSELTDGERKKLEDGYNQQQEARQNLTEEEILERKLDTLQRIYYNEYENLVKSKLPLNSSTVTSDAARQIKNICLFLAYDSTSKLISRLSPYKNPAVRFGSYDNSQWWEVKYRQLLLLYLQGEKQTAKDLIASLRVRHRSMGGEKFQAKFRELEQRP